MAETIRLTYRELAERLGIALDSARIKAGRHARSGRWRLIDGNYPGAPKLVELPEADLARGEHDGAGAPLRPTGERIAADADAPPSARIAEFEALVAELRTTLEHERQDRIAERQAGADKLRVLTELVDRYMAASAAEAERERAAHRETVDRLRQELEEVRGEATEALADMQRRAEAAEGMARTQADSARRERDRLDALHRAREAEIDEHVKLRAERDRLAAELAALRKPWWRRWRPG